MSEEVDLVIQVCFVSAVILCQMFMLYLMYPSGQSAQAPANEDNEVQNEEVLPFPTHEPAITSRQVYSDVWSAPRTKPRCVRRLVFD